MKIKKINKVKETNTRYDIHVDKFSCYYANNILVHNSDGQNIMFTFKSGKIYAARNKTQIKSPISIPQLAKMFAGRGNIKDAFVFAMQDLQKAISKLSVADQTSIFNDGKTYMNMEIMYPPTENVILYDFSALQLHGTSEFDENYKLVTQNPRAATKLVNLLKKVNADTQKHFNIIPPKILTVKKSVDFSKQKSKLIAALNKLKKQFKLKDSDNLGEYDKRRWEEFVQKQAAKLKYPIENRISAILVNRWAFGIKQPSIRAVMKDIPNEKFKIWVSSFDKKDHKQQIKDNIKPFDDIITEWGIIILNNISDYMSANPSAAVDKMKKELQNVKRDIMKSGDENKIKTLRTHLDQINRFGIDNIVPSEGIVFIYKGKTYKITGLFANLNQVLGILKFTR